MNNDAIINLKNVTFTYPSSTADTLSNITLSIPRGAFVLVSGPTGCGKSTLLKVLNGIIPFLSKGILCGEVSIAGIKSVNADMAALTNEVGLIFQNPNDQIVSNSVEEEIAFGLENIGLDHHEIRKRIKWASERLSISNLLDRDPNTLSGGQRQRVVIASQIAMHPKILAFDEPLSSLDPDSAEEVMQCIEDLNVDGITIIMVEHRISFVAPYCSDVLLMDKGKIVWYGLRDDAFMNNHILFDKYGIEVPDEVLICRRAEAERLSFDTDVLSEYAGRIFDGSFPDRNINVPVKKQIKRETCIKIDNISFGYVKNKMVLEDISLNFHSGESIAVMGSNGTGKSTLFSLISGLNRPSKGTVTVKGLESHKIPTKKRPLLLGYLIQNPDMMLFCETVFQELAFGPEAAGKNSPVDNASIVKLLETLDISQFSGRAPFSLSMGQRLRTAIGAVLSLKPEIVLLDEPTTGQNSRNIRRLMEVLFSSCFVKTVLFCTHDFNIAMEYADRVIIMSDGKVAADAAPVEILSNPSILHDAGLTPPLSTLITRSAGLWPLMSLPHEFRYALKNLNKNNEVSSYMEA